VKLLFSAGATTTHDALGSLVHTLLTVPEAWWKAVSDKALRPGAIRELLRWETPVPNLPRISADQSVDFLGEELPPQSFVLFSMAAANRDPAVFDDPDRYDMERASKDTLTFGRGERSCPGMHLARKSLAVALDALTERLPNLRLVGDPEASAPTGATVRGPDRLAVMWH
jgi:cytochrome P450